MFRALLTLSAFVYGAAAQAADSHHHGAGHQHKAGSQYSGQEKRAIKSLSAADIKELRRGGGWGLAKAAELNGVPGPAHLLELKNEIPLTESQILAVSALFEEMRSQAITQGEKLIRLERALEMHFQNRTITEPILKASLEAIENTRKELRFVHLATHLKTPKILSEDQIAKYNALRGYAAK